MNFNEYNGLKLPYDLALLGDINSIDSIRERLKCVRPLWPTILASLHVIYKGVGKAAKALQENAIF